MMESIISVTYDRKRGFPMYQELEKNLRRAMNKAIDGHDVMGVNFLAQKDGKEVLYCGEGFADREAGRPIARDTIFRLYSMTKPVTAAAVMLLLERGEIELYQPVCDILPAFAGQKVYEDGILKTPGRPVMIHDLLCMTSGLSYPDELTEAGRASGKVFDEAVARLGSENPMTTMELVNRLAEGPLAFAPGSLWQYGTSADVLGAVIEAVSGKKFSEFLKEEIFLPLGMEDTAFWVPKEKQNRLAVTYETVTEDGDKKMIRYTGHNLAINNAMDKAPAYEAGGAGIVSTLDDYMKFAQMLLNGGSYGSAQILQEKTVRYLTEGRLLPHQDAELQHWIGLDGFTYSNLMRRCVEPERHKNLCAYGEYGWDGWLGMYFANFPKEKLTILIGTQKKDAGTFSLTRKIRNIALGALL